MTAGGPVNIRQGISEILVTDAPVSVQGGEHGGFLELMFTADETILDSGSASAELFDLDQDLAWVLYAE